MPLPDDVISPGSADARLRRRLAPWLGLTALLVALAGMAGAAATRTSATFDEMFLVASGARAVETGSWSMVVDHPPLMALLYGLSVRAARPAFPSEVREGGWTFDDRWEYARDFYFRTGNDPVRLALLSRSVAVLLALGLVLAAFLYGLWIEGVRTALMGGFLVAFLPDVVAHGAVAYNDVPLALAYLLAAWALDVAVRRPSVTTGVVAGAAVALALGVKFSALALGPVAALLVGFEAARRDRRDVVEWLGRLLAAGGSGALAAWLVLALLYGGDVFLIDLEHGLRFTLRHTSEGHPTPAWLLGATSPDGWWYFFPAAFLVKTPAALHLLMPLAIAGPWLAGRTGTGRSRRVGVRRRLSGRLRGPAVAAAVFGGFLLASRLDIGFRHALPALPPLLLLVAVGLSRLWGVGDLRRRAALLLLFLLYAGSTLSSFPWFLSYRSEWARARGAEPPVLLDSSVDWGQGLLDLRRWMAEEDVARVRLGYFGSALPGGYGIAYEALPSFLPLPPGDASGSGTGTPAPGWTVLSVTLLHGLYVEGDPYAAYRERDPDVVLGGSLNVYRERAVEEPRRP